MAKGENSVGNATVLVAISSPARDQAKQYLSDMNVYIANHWLNFNTNTGSHVLFSPNKCRIFFLNPVAFFNLKINNNKNKNK